MWVPKDQICDNESSACLVNLNLIWDWTQIAMVFNAKVHEIRGAWYCDKYKLVVQSKWKYMNITGRAVYSKPLQLLWGCVSTRGCVTILVYHWTEVGPLVGNAVAPVEARRSTPMFLMPITCRFLPLADSFLVLMIFAAYSWPDSTLTHRRTTENAPLKKTKTY